jgi:GNAT superfamily N-acetyltransferase
MNIRVEKARRDQVEETARIYIESHQFDFPFLPADHRESLDLATEVEECHAWLDAHSLNCMFVAIAGERMAGYIAVGPNTAEPLTYGGEITGFFVRRDYRRQGIGLRLLNRAGRYLQDAGYDRVLVYTLAQSESAAYYRRLGGMPLRQDTQIFGSEPQEVDILGWEIVDLLAMLSARLQCWIHE